MNNRKVPAFLLAACAVFAVVPALSAADPRKSHRPIGTGGTLDDKDLTERLQPAQDLGALIGLVEKIQKNPEKFPKLNDRLNKALVDQFLKEPDKQKLLQNPQVQKMLREAVKNQKLTDKQLDDLRNRFDKIPPEDLQKLADEVNKNPDDFNLDDKEREELQKRLKQSQGKLSPEDLKKLHDLFNKSVGQNPTVQGEKVDEDLLKRALPNPVGQPPNMPPNEGEDVFPPVKPAPPGEEKKEDPTETPPIPAETVQDPNETASDLLLKLADFISDLDVESDGELRDRVSNLLRDVANGNSGGWLGSMHTSEWRPSDETKETAASWIDKLSNLSMPKMKGAPSETTMAGSSNVGSANAADTEKLARIFVWGVVAVIVGFVGWRLLLWYRNPQGGGLPTRWPVPPDQVATRGDLVRAFEYLALRLLGMDAKHRHHLDLAERLGGPTLEVPDARRQAANHLAHLYELARYAPADEPLPESELAAARRDLSYLAGAGAA